MNWLTHILLSEPSVENRLGNLLGDLVKGKEIEKLSYNLRIGIDRHHAIDRFTDNHPITKISKERIDGEYKRFAGVLVDIFYDHFLATQWINYSSILLSEFTSEIYESFQSYKGEIPLSANETIQQMIAEDWLSSYQHLYGIQNALNRIDNRIQKHTGRKTNLGQSILILEEKYSSFEKDFKGFFPDLQHYIEKNYS